MRTVISNTAFAYFKQIKRPHVTKVQTNGIINSTLSLNSPFGNYVTRGSKLNNKH